MCDHGRTVREGSNEQTLGSEFSVGEGPVKNVRTCVHNQQQRARNKTMRNTHTHTHTSPDCLVVIVVVRSRCHCQTSKLCISRRFTIASSYRRRPSSSLVVVSRSSSLSPSFAVLLLPEWDTPNIETKEKTDRHTKAHTPQHNTTQHNTTQHNTTQHNKTQHNTIQRNTTQYNAAPAYTHIARSLITFPCLPLFLRCLC